MAQIKFEGVLELHGKAATGIEVPAEVIQQLGGGKRPAVVVSFREFSFRTTVGVMGGRFLIPVSAERRTASGAVAGDSLTVTVELA